MALPPAAAPCRRRPKSLSNAPPLPPRLTAPLSAPPSPPVFARVAHPLSSNPSPRPLHRRRPPPRPLPTLQPRIARALRHTSLHWAGPASPTLFALAPLLPLTTAFMARLAVPPARGATSTAVAYPALVQLRAGLLVVRAGTPAAPAVAALSVTAAPTRPVSGGRLQLRDLVIAPAPVRVAQSAAAHLRTACAHTLPPLSTTLRPVARLSSRRVLVRTADGILLALLIVPRAPASLPGRARAHLLHARAAGAAVAMLPGPHALLPLRLAVESERAACLGMPYCVGGDLATLVATCPLTDHAAVQLAAQILVAVRRAQRVGLRPLPYVRPTNVLFDAAGWVRLSELGPAPVRDHTLLKHAFACRQHGRGTFQHPGPPEYRYEHEGQEADDDYEEYDGDEDREEDMYGGGGGLFDVDGDDEEDKAVAFNSGAPALAALLYFAMTGRSIARRSGGLGGLDSVSGLTSSEDSAGSASDGIGWPGVASGVARDFLSQLATGKGKRGGLHAAMRHPWMEGVRWRRISRREGDSGIEVEAGLPRVSHEDVHDLAEMAEMYGLGTCAVGGISVLRAPRMKRLTEMLKRRVSISMPGGAGLRYDADGGGDHDEWVAFGFPFAWWGDKDDGAKTGGPGRTRRLSLARHSTDGGATRRKRLSFRLSREKSGRGD